MSAGLLTQDTIMTCPHGGTVVAESLFPRVSLNGSTAVYTTDTFLITGCPFAPGAPHPCVQVRWQLPSQRCAGNGAAMLTADSVGLCYAADGALQGTVQIHATQTQVTGD
jgi:hypothetical protein